MGRCRGSRRDVQAAILNLPAATRATCSQLSRTSRPRRARTASASCATGYWSSPTAGRVIRLRPLDPRPQVEIVAALAQAARTSSGSALGGTGGRRAGSVATCARAADASGPARPTSIAAGEGLRARKTGAATPAVDGLDLELTPGRRNGWDASAG
jgi:hypothetical protein